MGYKIAWKFGDHGQKVWQIVTPAQGGSAYWTVRTFATRAEAREGLRMLRADPPPC